MIGRLLGSREDRGMVPHEGPVPPDEPKKPATGGRSGALRAAVFGINDGLLSNLSLIIGVTGATVNNTIVVVAGLAGLLAGAFSMGYGEYISMRVQRELFERLIHLEAHELATEPEEERIELSGIYQRKGVPADVAERLVDVIHKDPKLALETHAREELGLDPEGGLGSPWAAALSSFVMFSIGAVIPLFPFLVGSGHAAQLAAVIAGATTLFTVGSLMSIITGKHAFRSGLRMLVGGCAIAAITYAVGRAFHANVA
ncbi:MAG: VIT1/CCC1 transporter family protein [Actinomycetota bacterium]